MDELNITSGGETPTAAEGAESVSAEATQPVETQATPETPAAEEFSAGWSYGEEEAEEAPELTDEQIAELAQDPALDQARVPGLVEKLRGAWSEAKGYKTQVRQLQEQLAQLEQYGGIEGAGQMAGLAASLITDPVNGAAPFMASLAKDALPAYQAIADQLVQYEHEYLLKALQASGKIPETPTAAATQLTAEDWARIPAELHEVAKQIPVHELINHLDNGNDETLRMMLETRKEISELKGAQRAQAEQAYRQAYQQAEQQGYQSVQSLSDQYEKAHLAQLSKWQPFGPQAGDENQRLYRMVLEGAFAEILSDQTWQTHHRDMIKALQQAPLRRLNGEQMAADADERKAREAAARFNTRLGQIMKSTIRSLDSVFRDARAYRESQRQNIPNRTEISGSSAQTGRNGAPPTLLPNGKTNPAYLEYVISNIPGAKQG